MSTIGFVLPDVSPCILDWVGLDFVFSTVCPPPNAALANMNLAEVARQLGNMAEQPNQSQPGSGL